jgi:hypothetical protein
MSIVNVACPVMVQHFSHFAIFNAVSGSRFPDAALVAAFDRASYKSTGVQSNYTNRTDAQKPSYQVVDSFGYWRNCVV